MRNLPVACLVLCACASSPPQPQVIENHVFISASPSLERNIAATVSVYATFENLNTGEIAHAKEIGVVIDRMHVLAYSIHTDGAMASYLGWGYYERIRIKSIGITEYVADRNGVVKGEVPANALPAKIVAETEKVSVFKVSQPLSVAPVVFATNKSKLWDAVYAISRASDENPNLHIWSGKISVLLRGANQQDFGNNLVIVFDKDDYVLPCGVFNERHEFIGFFVKNQYVMTFQSLAPILNGVGITSARE